MSITGLEGVGVDDCTFGLFFLDVDALLIIFLTHQTRKTTNPNKTNLMNIS
jgi:hypothetical protein